MKTVFLTGGSSALGRRLIEALHPAFRFLVATHRRSLDVPGLSVEELPQGLERCEELADRIRSSDVIVHLAAVTHSKDPARYEAVNHGLTRRLLAVARPGQRFVFMSTLCATPDAGAYGVSKWHAEQAVQASALDWVIIRPGEIYGSKAGEGIDALLHLAQRWGVLPDFRQAGSVRYAPISTGEVADFLVRAVESPRRARVTYTVCASHPCTAPELARALRAGGRRAVAVPVPVALLRAAVRLRLPVPFKADQLDRLVARKDYDLASAQADYAFQPRDLLADLAAGTPVGSP